MSSKIKVDQIENTDGVGDVAFTGTGGISLSSVKLSTIKSSNGTTGLTVANTGIVTASKEIVETDYMLQQWRLAQDSNQGVDDFLKGSGTWEPVDNAAYHVIGNYQSSADMSLDVSTGTFSFPRTGVYLVRFFASLRLGTTDSTAHILIYATVDGGATNYVEQARATLGHIVIGGTANSWGNGVCETLVNVTNTTNVKVRFGTSHLNADTYVGGADGTTISCVMFERKGPAQ